MHKQIPLQVPNGSILSQNLYSNIQSLNINCPKSQLEFTIKRRRSLTSLNANKTQSLQTVNKTPSPKHINRQPSLSESLTLKDNNYLKPNVLNKKFHQLTLNPTQKKPLKLKISKLNNQHPNQILKQHLNDFSKELDNKFQTQNKFIKNSLQKIQKLVIKNTKLPEINKPTQISHLHAPQQQFKQLNNQKFNNQFQSQPKQSTIYITQNHSHSNTNFKLQQHSCDEKQNTKLQSLIEKNQILQNQMSEFLGEKEKTIQKLSHLMKENQKLMQEIKETKTINNFLVSENYKLSLQISFLKEKIVQSEHKDYQEGNLTGSAIIKSQRDQQKASILQNYSQQFLKQSFSQSKQSSQAHDLISRKDLLIKQIKTQKFSLMNKHIQDQEPLAISNLKSYKNLTNSNTQINDTFQNKITKLSQKIQQLQEQLDEQKNVNQNLSNKLAVLKLQQHGVKRQSKKIHKQNQSLDSVVSIKINLQPQDLVDNSQSNPQLLKKTASFHQSLKKTKRSQPSLENIPHRASKSKILSNQFIYFAETIESQKQRHDTSIDKKQPDNQPKTDMNQTIRQQNTFLGTIRQQDEDEKKKTLCMKKLQIPAEQIRKRRKTISQQLNISLQNKGTRKRNINNSLSFYSKHKIAQLQILKQTISLKFQAFKYTYELFQSQMILWPNRTASTKDLKSILSEYPFLLQESSIDFLLSYCDALETEGIAIDLFCNKMREFIAEYAEITEEQELVLEKKILKRWKYTGQEILELMRKSETIPGEITKESFMSIFVEFKFEANEIHHLLSQSVAISPDLKRIKYRHYLQNFLAKN